MTAQLSPAPVFSSRDNFGFPLVGGKLYTYAAGTTTPQATYVDSTQTTSNTNPIILNYRGEAFVWTNPLQTYKFVLFDALGNLVWSEDNIPGGAFISASGTLPIGVSLLPTPTNTLTLGNATFSWANVYVGPANAPIFDPVSGNVGYYARTGAEIAAGVTPVDYSYPPGDARRYGTNTTPGTTDMTAALQAAVNQHGAGGAPVYVPGGSYLIGAITFPSSQYGFAFTGDGPGRTSFIAKTGNITLFQKGSSAGVLESASIGGFSIQASTSGSTATAFNCSGFRTSKFTNIRGVSNGGTTGFFSLFSMSAAPFFCYGNMFDSCGLDQTTGWTKGWDFNNNLTGAANNANVTLILNPWFYLNTGLTFCIDALRSAMTTIIGGDFEDNAPAVAINSGNTTVIQGSWFELNGNSSIVADITYNSASDGTANSGLVIGCYFSGTHTINFNASGQCSANIWIGNNEVGAQTWANNNGTNLRLQGTGTSPSAPTISNTAGTSGTLAIVGTASQLTEPNLSNMISYLMEYTWTPSAGGAQSQFTLTVPSGYELAFLSVGSTLNASGLPYPTAVAGTAAFYVSNVSAGAVTLTIYAMIKHIDT